MKIFEKYDFCNSAYPNSFTIATDGRIAKCENISEFKDEMYIGQLNEDGEIVYRDNLKNWEDDYEMEACKKCLIYPICCARGCPAQKAMYPQKRPDCQKKQEDFAKRMLHFAENQM